MARYKRVTGKKFHHRLHILPTGPLGRSFAGSSLSYVGERFGVCVCMCVCGCSVREGEDARLKSFIHINTHTCTLDIPFFFWSCWNCPNVNVCIYVCIYTYFNFLIGHFTFSFDFILVSLFLFFYFVLSSVSFIN